MRREKSFRGISTRLAAHYLTNLGGERAGGGKREADDAEADGGDEVTVTGEDWRATLSSETVEIGPSLTITEVTVVFEGEEATLEPLVERFSQKAMRAGG